MKWVYIIIGVIAFFTIPIAITLINNPIQENDTTIKFTPIKIQPLDTNKIELEIHDLVNQYRIENGLEPLEFDHDLAQIAKNHSKDMAINNYFEHEDLNGNDFLTRYDSFGYDCTIVTPTLIGSGGENIALVYDKNNIASEAVTGWIDSPLHRENLLTDYFENQGIGVYVQDGVYITQNFC